MKLFPVLLLSGLLSGSCVYADGVTIIAFGDSTTAFRKGKIDKVYSIRLQEALAEKRIDANVINEGVGGSHSGFLADMVEALTPVVIKSLNAGLVQPDKTASGEN